MIAKFQKLRPSKDINLPKVALPEELHKFSKETLISDGIEFLIKTLFSPHLIANGDIWIPFELTESLKYCGKYYKMTQCYQFLADTV